MVLENGAVERQIDVSIGDVEVVNVAELQLVGKTRQRIGGEQLDEIPAAFEAVAARIASPRRELV